MLSGVIRETCKREGTGEVVGLASVRLITVPVGLWRCITK